MTVSTTTSEASFVGNGVTTTFPLGFEIESATHLAIAITQLNGVMTSLVLNVDYAVTNVGAESGATVLTTFPPASGAILTVKRQTPRTQPNQLLPSSGFSPRAVEFALDRVVLIVQESATLADRGIRVPVGEVSAEIPPLGVRANKLFGFDGAGRPVAAELLEGDAITTPYTRELLTAIDPASARNVLEVVDPSNRIINGNFSIWQRGTSTTLSAYGADRWLNSHSGGTVTQSLQGFPIGTQLGKSSPRFFLRQSVTGQSLASHRAHTIQRIEGVGSYANGRVTVLGFARRASGSGSFTVSCRQNFGTGGSPSATVNLPCGVIIPLTTEWAPFEAVIDLPPITGKTLGTDGNSSLEVELWTSAGSDHPRASGLGIQTIEVDFWGIHILQGYHPAATALNYQERPPHEEIAACQRYYEIGSGFIQTSAPGLAGFRAQMTSQKRAFPSVTISNISGTNIAVNPALQGAGFNAIGFNFSASVGGGFCDFTWTADAEL
jgi:hypothetical protein